MSHLRPTPWEWVAVMAFYAAVHSVNAYFWETRRYAPGNHGERATEMRFDLRLTACRRSYGFLNGTGFRARYDETFMLAEPDALLLLDTHFRRVEATVMQALGQPVPTW